MSWILYSVPHSWSLSIINITDFFQIFNKYNLSIDDCHITNLWKTFWIKYIYKVNELKKKFFFL